MPKLLFVVGARPNFMKVAPVLEAVRSYRTVEPILVHTGQHYDAAMSDVFFSQLGLPAPDHNLGVGGGSQADQVARLIQALEPVLCREKPDCVVVAGDVNSTMAAALVAVKLGIPIAHIEAGLRSHDWTMPEEANRVVTDRLSNLLFTSSPEGRANLAREGIRDGARDGIRRRVHFVGNAMIDSLRKFEPIAMKNPIVDKLGLVPKGYGLVTLHRPANVDRPDDLGRVVRIVLAASRYAPIVFPIHPRTRSSLEQSRSEPAKRLVRNPAIALLEPQGYVEFLKLQMEARFVLTDSGGVQEETTVLGVPCLTLRGNTERPVTVSRGSNSLLGQDEGKTIRMLDKIERGTYKRARAIPRWDGRTGPRIARILARIEEKKPR